ncbi:MAG TPA: class I SAM-dependent methyltransferase [Bryobacteraceae bacterium]|jgi:SAM-dependent methyltransferase|nr:class I SAM-dependent methyltransferase [Bryobacteraceae bacterium]
MPACRVCPYFASDSSCTAHGKASEVLARPLPPPPLGPCIIPITDGYLAQIGPGMRILDVGCGTYRAIRSYCQSVGAEYEGIDIGATYFGKPVVATRIENLADLSFPDECFDMVIGNQTMEHWAESGCSLRWGLYQCFRVCKPNGRVLMNVPIHFHGTREFLLGRTEAIRRYFGEFSSTVCFEAWGVPSTPIPPLVYFPWYMPRLSKPAFILDIQATKDKPLPVGVRRGFRATGRLAELRNYPVSYNIHRVFRKAAAWGS